MSQNNRRIISEEELIEKIKEKEMAQISTDQEVDEFAFVRKVLKKNKQLKRDRKEALDSADMFADTLNALMEKIDEAHEQGWIANSKYRELIEIAVGQHPEKEIAESLPSGRIVSLSVENKNRIVENLATLIKDMVKVCRPMQELYSNGVAYAEARKFVENMANNLTETEEVIVVTGDTIQNYPSNVTYTEMGKL